MLVKFERIVDDQMVSESYDGPIIIKACFEPCTEDVQTELAQFLDDKSKVIKTFDFGKFKVKLTKWRN